MIACDSGIFRDTELHARLENNTLGVPKPASLPDAEDDIGEIPYVMVADEAFPMSKYCLRPYSGTQRTDDELIFSYRLSRARRCVESGFGILAQRQAHNIVFYLTYKQTNHIFRFAFKLIKLVCNTRSTHYLEIHALMLCIRFTHENSNKF